MHVDMGRMIFVTGFARGGTSWLRSCIAHHPDVEAIPKELTIFRDLGPDRPALERAIAEAVETHGLAEASRLVNKAPANAPHVAEAARALPEARFVFIIRDPRDVLVSHKRGTQAWMGGENSTVDGCMRKTRRYYEGYERAAGLTNVLLVRYEDLHQDFHGEMRRVLDFAGLPADDDLLEGCYRACNFWTVASRHIEDRDSARRKGVVGDWVTFLDEREIRWYRRSDYWRAFMERHGYGWTVPTNERLLAAMHEAGARFLAEQDVLDQRLAPDRLNVLVTTDVDLLGRRVEASILETASLLARFDAPAVFYFLPLDDPRYREFAPARVVETIREVRRRNPAIAIGLHLNCAERFFPPDLPDLGNDHPDVSEAIAYLHAQIDAYAEHGIHFATATAHGYGRRKKTPNNRDTPVFTAELATRGVRIWDNDLRPALFGAAAHVGHCSDVGGAVSMRQIPNDGAPTDPRTYRHFPPGSVLHVLLHPGNYDVHRPLTLGIRSNTSDRVRLPREASLQPA